MIQDNDHAQVLGIYSTLPPTYSNQALLTKTLSLPLLKDPPAALAEGDFVLVEEADKRLTLHFTGRGTPSPLQVDFLSGSAAHRRQFGGGKGQLIAKAVGVKQGFRPSVLDLTAGLGQDAFVLATLGCELTLVERVPLIHALLDDGLNRARADENLREITARMNCYLINGIDYLKQLQDKVDVIYLDPMFPPREKSAKVKKAMAAFHQLVGLDEDAGELLSLALEKARYRVVIKRPRKAPTISEEYPALKLPKNGLTLSGKSSRYDIYPLAKMP